MTKNEVLNLLEENKNEEGIKHWEKTGDENLSSYGIGVNQLKKLAKKIGKEHELALELWKQPNYEAKTIATLVEEPKKVTKEQAENQIEDTSFRLLSYSYCSNLLSKVDFKSELAVEWTLSNDDIKRRCAYLLLYHIAKEENNLTEDFFVSYVNLIEEKIQEEENFVKDAMNNALLKIGERSKALNEKAIGVAKSIGRIEVDYGDNSCRPVDVVKHLSSEKVQKKLNHVIES